MSVELVRHARFVNLQGANAQAFWEAVAGWLGDVTRQPIAIAAEGDWRAWRDQLARGEVSLGTVCGSDYVQWADMPTPAVELLCAPIMLEERYEGRPVYFSDVLVRADSEFEMLEELGGARWAYNDEHSFSGYHLVRRELALRGLSFGYFGSLVASGSHLASLALLRAGAADATAIDSIVLEADWREAPQRADAFRWLETWGPSPAPPVVASTQVPPAWRARWRNALLEMHRHPLGRRILQRAGVAAFTVMGDADYDVVRAAMRDPSQPVFKDRSRRAQPFGG